jgi:hypothetical protein
VCGVVVVSPLRTGISNLEECPLNRNIPVFVLVGGAIALLKLLQVLWKQYNRQRGPGDEEATDTQNGSVRTPNEADFQLIRLAVK